MSRVTELEKALTTLFRKGTEVGYTETEIDEFLENIDYHALLQAVWNKAETVYAYRADGKNALSLDYRSSELFKQRATLLYEDVGDSYIGAVFAARSMELWLRYGLCRRCQIQRERRRRRIRHRVSRLQGQRLGRQRDFSGFGGLGGRACRPVRSLLRTRAAHL